MLAIALLVLPAAGLVSASVIAAGGADWVKVPGGSFRSTLKYEDATQVKLAAFELQKRPVTNAEFLAFVKAHPQWRRDRVPSVLAEKRFLQHWAGPTTLGGTALPQQPVVNVSWFAAEAFCAAQDARLPTWNEWEFVAAADETRRDAREDPRWRERILGWYSKPSNQALPRAGLQAPNVYGVQDVHGLVWEWTEDFSSLLVDPESRNQGDPDKSKFCGAGALSMNDRDNYAVLMRVAMLSSLQARDITPNLGFRCARSTRK